MWHRVRENLPEKSGQYWICKTMPAGWIVERAKYTKGRGFRHDDWVCEMYPPQLPMELIKSDHLNIKIG